jgi:hypothetical protein
MRKTLARFTSSFAALLSDPATVIDADSRVEIIRDAMLEALSTAGQPQMGGSSKTWTDVARAADVQTLWYLRSDVLRVLSESYGEQAARDRLVALTELFRGVVSDNQMPLVRRQRR